MKRIMLRVVGGTMWIASLAIGLSLSWTFIADEMTQGAFLKEFWFESFVSSALLVVGVGLVMAAEDGKPY